VTEMSNLGKALRRRYGHSESGVPARTTLRVMARREWVSDAPGGSHSALVPGDRVEVGGEAANTDYLVVYRVQRLGEGWTRLGPFAVVLKSSLAPKRRRRP
jgi:hypothetical protein